MIMERLDRGLANDTLLEIFPFLIERHLVSSMSDQAPLLFHFSNQPLCQINRRKRSFRFENMWIRHEGCEVVISAGWKKNRISNFEVLLKGVQQCRISLSKWNKDVFGNIQYKIK